MRIRFLLGQKHANARRASLGRTGNGAERRIDLAVFPPRYGRLGRPKSTRQRGLTDTGPPARSANHDPTMHKDQVSRSANPTGCGISLVDRSKTGPISSGAGPQSAPEKIQVVAVRGVETASWAVPASFCAPHFPHLLALSILALIDSRAVAPSFLRVRVIRA